MGIKKKEVYSIGKIDNVNILYLNVLTFEKQLFTIEITRKKEGFYEVQIFYYRFSYKYSS